MGGAVKALLMRAGVVFEGAAADEWRRGWRLVAGAGIGLGTGVSLYLLSSSLFIDGLTKEFGWSRGDLGLAGLVAFVVGAAALSITGKLVDRYGYRPVVMVCAPAMALLYLMVALQPGSFAFYLALMVWGGAFGAGTGAIAYTRPVIAAFAESRGLALGFATCGVSLTTIAFTPVLGWIIETQGWRAGFVALAAVTAVIGLPLALWVMASGRSAGASQAAAHDAALDEIPRAARVRVPDVTVAEALRMRSFWLIVAALFAVNIPGAGILGQLAPLMSDKGFSATAAGTLTALYAAGLLAGRLATGFALDRFPPALVATVMTAVPALGMLILLGSGGSFALAALAILMIGLQQGSEVDLIAYFVSRRFGVAHYSTIYGRVATFGAVGTAVGLLLFGYVHDLTASYDVALVLGAAAFAAGAVAFAGLGRG